MRPIVDESNRWRLCKQVLGDLHPNPDGEDYELDGKYAFGRVILRRVRNSPISEEVKLRRINTLKEEVIPLWYHFAELRQREGEELKAVFLKYHDSASMRQRYKDQYDEIKARIAASEDAALLEDIEAVCPVVCGPTGGLNFSYGGAATITYHRMGLELDRLETGGSGELPVINLVPLGAGDSIPHHNKNPDDDLSLNPTLLKLLHHLMGCEHAAPFINLDDEKKELDYYYVASKPRWLKFIEQGLTSDPSIGYGATAFFNDMLLLLRNPKKYDGNPTAKARHQAVQVEIEMKRELRKMGSVGEQLLELYEAIEGQGMELWDDPEIICFQEHYHPRSPAYDGSIPDETIIKSRAWDQLQQGQKRVRELRRRMASTKSNTAEIDDIPAPDGDSPPNPEPIERPLEESAEPDQDGPSRRPKGQRSDNRASPGPSKRPREPTVDDYDGYGKEAEQGDAADSRAAKRQRLTESVAPSILPAVSSGTPDPVSYAAPAPGSASKRARTSVDADADGDDQSDGGGDGPPSSKRRRLTKDTSPSGLPAASPQPGPSTAAEATNEPAAHGSGSSQAQASSAAGQPALQQSQQPAQPAAPSSQALPSSSNTVTMRKITKMGKTRPWVFGYSTDEGYGLYAFMKCPGQNCRQRFTTNPLKDNRARDHLLGCNQPILDEQDMVRQYASQVIKDTGRKSDLTVDWARKSNMNLLPSNQKDNHPDNFPLSAAGH